MAGGNAQGMAAMMSGFSDNSWYRPQHNSTQADSYYQARLKQWATDQEHAYNEKWAQEQSDNIRNMVGQQGGTEGLINQQGISPDMASALQVVSSLASGNPFSVAPSYELLQKIQGAYTQNAQKSEKQKDYEYSIRDPGFIDGIRSLAPPSNAAKMADEMGLTGEARTQFIHEVAMKSGTNINIGGHEKFGLLTEQEKKAYGFPPESNPYWSNEGPKIAQGKPSEAVTRENNVRSLESLEKDVSEFNKNYPDYNKSNLLDVLGNALQADPGPITGTIGSAMSSEPGKIYGNYAREWVNINRNLMSGAAVPAGEVIKDLNIYWPTVGDSKEVMAIKDNQRKKRLEILQRNTNGMSQQEQHDEYFKLRRETEDLLNKASSKPQAQQSSAAKQYFDKVKAQFPNLPDAKINEIVNGALNNGAAP